MATNEGVLPTPLVFAQDFLRGRVQRETISLGGAIIIMMIIIIIIIIIITIIIDDVSLLTCWECMLTYFINFFFNFDKLPCGGNDSMLIGRDCRLTFQGKATSIKVAGSHLKETDCQLIEIAGSTTSNPPRRGALFGRKLDQGRYPTSGLC